MDEYIIILETASNEVSWHMLTDKEMNMESEDLLKSLGFDYNYCLWAYISEIPVLKEV